MKAAEWRKYSEAIGFDVYALLRDFEAAERENERMNARIGEEEERSDKIQEAAHRLEDRCVAAEEERNRERRHGEWAMRELGDKRKTLSLFMVALREEEFYGKAEQQRREAAEARVRELEAALTKILGWREYHDHLPERTAGAVVGFVESVASAALSPQEPQEKGESRE
jgi:FMN phosphatase YigB (HAD superfamily)